MAFPHDSESPRLSEPAEPAQPAAPAAPAEPEALAAPAPTAFVDIALPLPVGLTFTYHLTPYQQERVKPGARVRVPVGRRRMIGYVVGTRTSAPEGFATRAIEALVDRDPVLPPELLELARFAADYYLTPLGDVLAAMIPAEADSWGDRRVRLTDRGAMALHHQPAGAALQALLLERGQMRISEIEEVLDDPQIEAILVQAIEEGGIAWDEAGARGERYAAAFELAPGDPDSLRERAGRSPAGRAVIDFLVALGRPALAEELRQGVGCSAAVLRRLAGLGILRRFSQPSRLGLDRHLLPLTAGTALPPEIRLRGDQESALAEIERAIAGGIFERFLLRGVTGSGKTEVYLRAAAAALACGRSVLLLVPEIALVPALAAAARERFPHELAVLHSGLGAAERQQEWARVRTGEARLVVGPRSALFAPVSRLGLIVVDEEQDLSYKQDSSPRYQGRDLALMRAKLAGAVAVLVSATPSSRPAWRSSPVALRPCTLSQRAGNGALPEGILVDLRHEPSVGMGGRTRLPGDVQFSERLIAEIERALAEGDQTILLRNRRGYAPLLLCRACGEDFRCADCGLPRTYHRKGGRGEQLICHYCDSRLAVPARCPVCRAETLEAIGAGTERIEEAVQQRFPDAAVDVLDRDALHRGGGPAAILERFQRGETQILVGTQMVSKGHHFPRVALDRHPLRRQLPRLPRLSRGGEDLRPADPTRRARRPGRAAGP